MKKTYLKPNTLVVKVEPQQVIALSRFDKAANSSTVYSREGSFSDDDWDE